MTLEQLNSVPYEQAQAALLHCCGSPAWADQMAAGRPYLNAGELLTAADRLWNQLDPSEWLAAFAAHPRIGQSPNSRWSAEEQRGIDASRTEILNQLAQSNHEYEKRFGWIFLISATGKTAPEMLRALESRLLNESAQELRIAAAEQAQITRLRLNKLLER